MFLKKNISLIKDCEGVLIPSATPITIPSGTKVKIIQILGGVATVQVEGYSIRISNNNINALGLSNELDSKIIESNKCNFKNTIKLKKLCISDIWIQIKTCYDPEIPINIVDLGLIYSCKIKINEKYETIIFIKMTLTTPGCGMGPIIMQEIKNRILLIKTIDKVYIKLVFNPPWTEKLMTDFARIELGLL